jgi:hypothetical protein
MKRRETSVPASVDAPVSAAEIERLRAVLKAAEGLVTARASEGRSPSEQLEAERYYVARRLDLEAAIRAAKGGT